MPRLVKSFKDFLRADWSGTPLTLPSISAAQTDPTANIAQYLLTRVGANDDITKALNSTANQPSESNNEEPGALSSFFDLLDTPRNTVANIVSDTFHADNPLESVTDALGDIAGGGANIIDKASPLLLPAWALDKAAEKITGDDPFAKWSEELTPKKYAHEALANAGVDNPWLKYGGGFVGDVLLDPLTYIPGLNAKKGVDVLEGVEDFAKAAKTAADPIKAGEAFTRSQAPKIEDLLGPKFATNKGRTAPPVASFLPEAPGPMPVEKLQRISDLAGKNIPEEELLGRYSPGMESAVRGMKGQRPLSLTDRATIVDNLRQGKLKAAGKVTDKKGNVSLASAAVSLERLSKGELPRIGQIADKPIGDEAGIAEDVARKFFDSEKGNTYNPVQQRNLFNRLYDATARMAPEGKNPARYAKQRFEQSVRMLRHSEDQLIEAGKSPAYWNGTRVRLSDVLANVGKTLKNKKDIDEFLTDFTLQDMRKIRNPALKQTISDQLARRSYNDAELISTLMQRAQKIKASIGESSSIMAEKQLADLPKEAQKQAEFLGLTPREALTAYDAVRGMLELDRIPTQKIMAKYGSEMLDDLNEGKVSLKSIHETTKEMEKMFGVKYEKLGKTISGNKAIDGFMTRFTTWYGREDVVQFKNDVFIWGERNAQGRATLARNIVKNYSKEEINDAWLVAAGRKAGVENSRSAQLAAQFMEYFDRMFGSSGMKDAVLEHTVTNKMSALMDDVNRHLGRIGVSDFRFSNKVEKDLVGTPMDYTDKGKGWYRSWEIANPKDPVSFMYNIDLAMERVAKEYALFDEFGARWGSKVKTSEKSMTVPHPRLEGLYFNEEIGKQMIRLSEDITENLWRTKGLVNWYARGLRAWKTGVTIYLPSHHIRNLIGDMHLMWWAGHNDPRAFMKARRILHSQRSAYKDALNTGDWNELDRFLNKDAMEWAGTGPTDIIIRQPGMNVTADQLYISAHQHGLLLDANIIEDVFDETPLAFGPSKFRPFGGAVHNKVASVAEYREHFVRMAHYVSAVEKRIKSGQKNLPKIFDDAAHEVRKWHPDGRDLTKFEQNARLLFPFYSWTRKAIPLIVQSAVTRPGKIMYYPRAMGALQGVSGIDAPSMIDPYPDDQLFPNWIRSMGVGPIGDASSDNKVAKFWGMLGKFETNLLGDPFGYSMVNPSNPFNDTVAQFLGMGLTNEPNAPLKGAGDMLTPAIRMPIEMMLGQKFTGQPISSDPLGYVAENIPLVAPVSRVTNSLGPWDTAQGKEQGNFDREALINILTALGLRGTAPYIKQAEFEARDRAR